MKKPKAIKSLQSSLRKPVWPCHPLKRVNYFTGQLLTADDFTAEQNYHLDKHRRHNLLCHGLGVVQGLQVSVAQETNGWAVIVDPGFAIDPLGNEIQVCADVRLRLRESASLLYVVVRFKECPTDPVPVPGEPGLDPGTSERYGRVQEGCEVLLSPRAGSAGSGPNRRRERCPAPALPLARLVRRGDSWSVDRTFKPAHAH